MKHIYLGLIAITALAFSSCNAGHNHGQPHDHPHPHSNNQSPFPIAQPVNERVCGGFTASPQSCHSGEYCHRNVEDICGAADAPGVCRPIPQACTKQYAPVCGCDGQTYSNECVANSHGISAASYGECR